MARKQREQRIERAELALFFRQFGGMLNAGIDLLGILDVLRKQTNNQKLRDVLDSVERDVSLGRLLSTAFGRFPEIFSPFVLSMLRQGEQEDVLDDAFVGIAEHLEREGDGGWMEGGDRVVVRSELDFSMQRLWPLLFWQAIGTAIVCVAIAGLWYATNAGSFPAGSLGPNVLLLVGVLIFLLSLICARFGPVRAVSCSFCGKAPEADEAFIKGRGAAICHNCLIQNHQFVTAGARQEVTAAPPPNPPEQAEDEEATLVEEVEEDIDEEPEFQILKSEDQYL
jgi:hypothetical protein